MVKQISSEVIIIVFTAIVLSLVVNSFRPDGIRIFRSHNYIKQPDNTVSPEDKNGVKEITVQDAVQCFHDGNVLFADARSPEDYAAGHIKGALNLPVHEFDNWIDDFISKREHSVKIITYCDGVHCELGKELSENLYLAGFENVFYLVNGWSRWIENGQPGEISE